MAPTALPGGNRDTAKPVSTEPAHPLAKKLICVTCGAKISYPEGKFRWNNSKRFAGLQYCREHQAGM